MLGLEAGGGFGVDHPGLASVQHLFTHQRKGVGIEHLVNEGPFVLASFFVFPDTLLALLRSFVGAFACFFLKLLVVLLLILGREWFAIARHQPLKWLAIKYQDLAGLY